MADPAFIQKLVFEQVAAFSASMFYEWRVRGDKFKQVCQQGSWFGGWGLPSVRGWQWEQVVTLSASVLYERCIRQHILSPYPCTTRFQLPTATH